MFASEGIIYWIDVGKGNNLIMQSGLDGSNVAVFFNATDRKPGIMISYIIIEYIT